MTGVVGMLWDNPSISSLPLLVFRLGKEGMREGDGVVEGEIEFWKVDWSLGWLFIYLSFELNLPSDLPL